MALKVRDVCHGDQVATRAVVMQHKTQRPVQFEITQAARDALQAGIKLAGLKQEDFLFPSRVHDSPHLGTRQYARILGHWVDELGLDRTELWQGSRHPRRPAAGWARWRLAGIRLVPQSFRGARGKAGVSAGEAARTASTGGPSTRRKWTGWAELSAEVLVTHEAPGYHPAGFDLIDTLAQSMGAKVVVHGHQHDRLDSSGRWASQGFKSFGVGLRGLTSIDEAGRAEVLLPGELDLQRAKGQRGPGDAGDV